MHIFRLDDTNYRDYQRCVRKIQYSYTKKGEKPYPYAALIAEATENSVCTKPEFIELVNDPNVEIYYLKSEQGENMGIACMKFHKKECHIDEFAVLEQYKGKGNGTAFFRMIMDETVYPRGCREVTVNCPFAGAQEFWMKLGFNFTKNSSQIGPYPLLRKKILR